MPLVSVAPTVPVGSNRPRWRNGIVFGPLRPERRPHKRRSERYVGVLYTCAPRYRLARWRSEVATRRWARSPSCRRAARISCGRPSSVVDARGKAIESATRSHCDVGWPTAWQSLSGWIVWARDLTANRAALPENKYGAGRMIEAPMTGISWT